MIERHAGEFTTLETRGEANESVDKAKRYIEILEILGDREMTAKEIAVEMFRRGYTESAERNYSAPRITELLQKGILDVIGKKTCTYTGKKVSVFKVRV